MGTVAPQIPRDIMRAMALPLIGSLPNGPKPQPRNVQVTRKTIGDLMLTEARYPSGTELSPHRHDPAAIISIIDGDYNETFQGRSFSLKRGDELFRPANAKHSNSIGKRGAAVFLVQFTPTWLEKLREYGPLYEKPVMPQPASTDRLVASIYRRWQLEDRSTELMIQGLAMELSAQLIQSTRTVYNHYPPSWLRRIREYVYERPTEELPLLTLALHAQVHPVHLCREFHRHYGQTLGEFIRIRRVEVAAQQIARGGDQNLTEIAINSGFASHAHFTSVFRKLMGVTPSQYRRSLSIRQK